jgi:hypothetical protein
MSLPRLLTTVVFVLAILVLLERRAPAQPRPDRPDRPPAERPGDFDRERPKPPHHPGEFEPGAAAPGDFGLPVPGGPRPKGPPRGEGPQQPGEPPRDGPFGPPPGLPPGPPRWPHQDWESLEKNDPEMYKLLKHDGELDRQTRELAARCRRAPTSQREEIKKQLQKVVTEQFEVRQARRQLEVKRLEEALQGLRDAIDRRNKARQDLVGKRVAELLGPEDDAGF